MISSEVEEDEVKEVRFKKSNIREINYKIT